MVRPTGYDEQSHPCTDPSSTSLLKMDKVTRHLRQASNIKTEIKKKKTESRNSEDIQMVQGITKMVRITFREKRIESR